MWKNCSVLWPRSPMSGGRPTRPEIWDGELDLTLRVSITTKIRFVASNLVSCWINSTNWSNRTLERTETAGIGLRPKSGINHHEKIRVLLGFDRFVPRVCDGGLWTITLWETKLWWKSDPSKDILERFSSILENYPILNFFTKLYFKRIGSPYILVDCSWR